MNAIDAVEEALRVVSQLRGVLARRKVERITDRDTRTSLKATAMAWFQSFKPTVCRELDASSVEPIDAEFRALLERVEGSIGRKWYLDTLGTIRAELVRLRAEVVARASGSRSEGTPADPDFAESPPDFTPLVADSEMRRILGGRWRETQLCLVAGAHLAATVMMGGLLEALLLARLNHMTDKRPAFTATAAPKDKLGKTLPLSQWTLHNYIEVAHELGWIRTSARDVGSVLRDYRNYIHPAREHAHGMTIVADDAEMFWSVFRRLTRQVVASV